MTSTSSTNEADRLLIQVAMSKHGWSDRELAVVSLGWEFDDLPPDQRAKQRYSYAVRMLRANGWSFVFSGNRPTPEPLEQLRVAIEEFADGEPHIFFLKKKNGGEPSEARAYSRDVRARILGLATAAVTRFHRNTGMGKRQAMVKVAQALFENGYTSATGEFTGQPDGLAKHCAAAEAGKASFQPYYDFAMRFEPPRSAADKDHGVDGLLGALKLNCTEYRLLPHARSGNSQL